MSTGDDWRRAFAKQANADFEMWDRAQSCRGVAECHRLHFLQMACEKLCKAHLCKTTPDPMAIQSSHRYVAKNLPIIAKEHLARQKRKTPKQHGYPLRQIRQLAREIELLAPSVDADGKRRDNCEYPWEVSPGAVRFPAEHQFTNLNLLTAPAGRTLLKCIKEAISQLI